MSTQKSKLASNQQHAGHAQSGERPAFREPALSEQAANAESSGFSGTCENASLADWIQLVQMGRRDAVIGVRTHEGKKALLWCRDGDIIDAWCDGLNGEDAVYRALAWDSGRVSVAFASFEHPRRIEIGTAALLLRAAYRRDSGVRAIRSPAASKVNATTPAPAQSASAADAAPSSNSLEPKLQPQRRTRALGAAALGLLAVLGLGLALTRSTGERAQSTPRAAPLRTDVEAARAQPTPAAAPAPPASPAKPTANVLQGAPEPEPLSVAPRTVRSAPAPRRAPPTAPLTPTVHRGNEGPPARRSLTPAKSKPDLEVIDERAPQVRIIDERDSQIEVIE